MGKSKWLRAALNEDKEYTLMELIETIKGDSCSCLIKSLLNLLNYDIESFNYEDDFSYLLKIFPYISNTLKEKVDLARLKIRENLKNKPDDIADNHPNYLFLKQLIENLENLELYFHYKLDHVYEGDRYSLINYLIFELKNITFVNQTFKEFKHIVNIIDEKGKSLISNVFNAYLKELNNNPNNRNILTYYDQVIKSMITSKKFRYLPKDLFNMLNQVCVELINLNKDDPYYEDKIYWLNNLKDRLTRKEFNSMTFDSLANRYNINYDFSDYLSDEIGLYENYHDKFDLTNRMILNDYIITIDNKGTEEIDDGLSARVLPNGNHLLGVHISNVTGVIPYDSYLIKEAIDRTTSIYLPDQTISMFPSSLSKNILSLVEGERRLATSYYFEINNQGEIQDYQFMKTIITTAKKSTYKEVNETLIKGKDETEFEKLCYTLFDITNNLSKKYHFDGIYEMVKNNNLDSSLKDMQNTAAGKIVRYTMMLTNNTIANHFARNHYPLLYRTHHINEDNNKKIKELFAKIPKEQRDANYDKLFKAIVSIYPRAEYNLSGRHDGLNLEHYCHATSPDRRAADIVVEECMNRCYFKEPTEKDIYFLEDQLSRIGKHINKKRSLIQDFVKEYQYIKK